MLYRAPEGWDWLFGDIKRCPNFFFFFLFCSQVNLALCYCLQTALTPQAKPDCTYEVVLKSWSTFDNWRIGYGAGAQYTITNRIVCNVFQVGCEQGRFLDFFLGGVSQVGPVISQNTA